MRERLVRITLLIPLFAILACSKGATAPVELVVPSEFSTIQAAVDAASAGEIVSVRGGDYLGIVTGKSGVNIIGTDGALLLGTFDLHSVHDVVVSGFTIMTDRHNQGILTNQSSNIVIRNNTLVSDGGNGDFRAIWLRECIDCEVTDNLMQYHRFDGISVVGVSTGTRIERNVIIENEGIGIVTWAGSSGAVVQNNTVLDNADCDIVNAAAPQAHTFNDNQAGCTRGLGASPNADATFESTVHVPKRVALREERAGENR
jgi:parallel beta-helix repeat protein